MKVLEAAKESKRLSGLINDVEDMGGFLICFQDHYDEVVFSVWAADTNSRVAARFNGNLELVDINGYKGDIEEARQALKKYLETEV